MKKVKHLIIGSGITGLSYANNIKDQDYLIIEKENEIGGYCRTIYQNGFVWDYAGHFFHFKTKELQEKFIESMSNDAYVKKEKKTYIYYNGSLIDYPFQSHIHQLEKTEFIDCLYDLFHREEKENYENFLDMLYGKFGTSIVEKFLRPYNEKLYACDLKKLDKDAMGRFFPYADIPAIIENMKTNRQNSYNNYFLYPRKGAQAIIDILTSQIDQNKIRLNTMVKEIHWDEHYVTLNNGETIQYDYLINTSPFHQFLKLFHSNSLSKLSDELTYNKVLVFNLGFNKKSTYNSQHWIYYPDKEINFYRVGFYDNILDTDKLSIYVEIGYAKDDEIDIDKQLNLTLRNLKKVGIIDDDFALEASASIVMDPAYVHIDTINDSKVQNVMKELESHHIYSIGRYGGWTYCSMEDCMIEAKELVVKMREVK